MLFQWSIIDDTTLQMICRVEDIFIEALKKGETILPGGLLLCNGYSLANILDFTYSLISMKVTIQFDCCYSYSSTLIKEWANTSPTEGIGYIPGRLNGIYPIIEILGSLHFHSLCFEKSEFYTEILELLIEEYNHPFIY